MSTLARPQRRLAYAICFALFSVLLALGVILSMPFGLLVGMLFIPGMVFYFLAEALGEPTPGELGRRARRSREIEAHKARERQADINYERLVRRYRRAQQRMIHEEHAHPKSIRTSVIDQGRSMNEIPEDAISIDRVPLTRRGRQPQRGVRTNG